MLVGENKEQSIAELILVQHALQLLTGLDNTVAIVAIHHEDNTLGVLEVVAPQRTDLVLTTDIPHGELNVLVFDGLNVEAWSLVSTSLFCVLRVSGISILRRVGCMDRGELTDGGDGSDDFTELQLVQDGGLSGGVETDHQNTHLLLPP